MALDQNAKYPVGTAAATADYPEGSAVNSSAPGALDGYPWEKDQINDRFGFEQALLRSSGQAASGFPDTAQDSQYLQAVVELAQGRAIVCDEAGVADAYVLNVKANQQAPQSLFDGQEFEFIAGNSNTTSSTASLLGLGIKNIVNTSRASAIVATKRYRIKYRLSTDDCIIIPLNSKGNNQTWQDVTVSRSLGVTYYNLTGDPIEVKIRGISPAGSTAGVNISVDGVPMPYSSISASNPTYTSATVPPGSSYVGNANGCTLGSWVELS